MGKITKIFIIIGTISLISCNKCKKPMEEENGWQRNPNLRLLAKPTPPFKAYSDAVWTSFGKIYYLAAYAVYQNWVKQALKVINEDGTGDRILFEGENFICLDISPNYDKLVIGTYDGKLILVDTSGNKIAEYKTHEYYYGNLHYVSWVKFGCPGDTIVYYGGASGSRYKMRLTDSTDTFLSYNGWPFEPFCIGDSGFAHHSTPWPTIWPLVDTIFISTYLGSPILANLYPDGRENEYLITGSIYNPIQWRKLPQLKPYEKSTFYKPKFSPDGKKLLFSAYDARWEANPHPWYDYAEFLELWIYEDIDKLLKEVYGLR